MRAPALHIHAGQAALRPRQLVAAGGLAITLLALKAVVSPGRADAFLGLPSPGKIVKDGVKSSFDFVIKTLFGGVPTKLTEAAISWQLHLPSEAFTASNVAELNRTTTAAAFAALSLVMTAAVLRYWLSGFTDGVGGGEAFTGVVRGVAAALAVVAWPWVFDASIQLVNSLTFSLVHASSVHDDVSRMLGAAVGISLTAGPVGMLASLVLVFAGTLLMLGLFALHVVLACALVLMFVAGPLLIVLTPFPGTAWMASLAFRAFATMLAWPVIWAVCFAAFAAVFNDLVQFRGDGGLLDKALVQPLTGAAMLYLCVKLPLLATRASMLGIGAGGTVGFAARYFAVRQIGTASNAIASSLRDDSSSRGGSKGATPKRRGSGPNSKSGSARPPVGSQLAGRATQGAGGTSAAVASGGAAAGAAGGVPKTPTTGAPLSGGSAGRGSTAGYNTPVGLRALGDRPRELEEKMHNARRRAGRHGAAPAASGADVDSSLRQLGPEQARGIGNVFDRAIAAGRNREEAVAAVTRAASIGAAHAEARGKPDQQHAFETIGSAPAPAVANGLDAYRAQQRDVPSSSPAPSAPAPSRVASASRPQERLGGADSQQAPGSDLPRPRGAR